jgi:hypothetical protein
LGVVGKRDGKIMEGHVKERSPQSKQGAAPASWTSLNYGQFVLGPVIPVAPESWQRIKIDDTTEVAAHPTLGVTQVVDGQKSLTLLGCLLDPLRPEATDSLVLQDLLDKSYSPAELPKATGRLGGRWILICRDQDQVLLFNDPMGLRQVFHTDPAHTGRVWAFSQPRFAEDLLGLEMDEAALRYMDSYVFRSDKEYRWPLTASPYAHVHRLLPNHWLDVKAGGCRRFWPDGQIGTRRLDDAVRDVSALMQGLLKAAANRFELAISVTAGIDSRLVWAACREVRDRVCFVSIRQSKAPDDFADIVVPARLAKRVGVEHHVIRAQATASAEFCALFKKNVFLAHDHYAADAEAILNRFSRTKVAVTGSGGELGRCYYGVRIPGYRRVTPAYLGKLDINESEFAAGHYADWLARRSEASDLQILDLFYWENRSAWMSMTSLEFDTAWRDIITPYNCRELLTAILSVDEKHREGPDYHLYRLTIRRLWPELLEEPINPHRHNAAADLKQRFKMSVKHAALAVQRVLPQRALR